jgi:hypothetical protein
VTNKKAAPPSIESVSPARSRVTVTQHFAGRPASVRATYGAVLKAARRLGTVREDPKKTSIHLARRTAFAGIATRRSSLIFTFKSATNIESPRIRKRERASANRWYLEVELATPQDVDRELCAWLEASYELGG